MMDVDDLKNNSCNTDWVGKTVFIITSDNRKYKGVVTDQNFLTLTILDKTKQKVMISFSQINILQEERY